MTKIECDAVLFDLDGVLIDSTACITRHWQQWAQLHGLDLDAIMQAAHGIRTVETMRLVAPHLAVEEEARRFTETEVVDTEGVVAIKGASRLLDALPSDAWAIVTSGSGELAKARLRHARLPNPEVLVTADDVVQGKPAPEPYLLAAERLGIAADRCLVIEDAPAGIQAARSAGMRVIAVAATHPGQELLKANAIVERLSSLDVTVKTAARSRLLVRTEWSC